MFSIKHIGAVLLLGCVTTVATTASAEPSSILAPAPPIPDAVAKPKTTAADLMTLSSTVLLVTGYALAVGVSLTADTSCQGSQCNERYLSFVPVFGGVLQFTVTSKAFHDQHHSDNCFPLTVADVTGQAVGAIGVVTGLVMRYFANRRARSDALTPLVMGGPLDGGGAGMGLRMQF